jgi:hypothetical protein
MIDVPEHPTAEQLAELRKTAVVKQRAAIQDMVPTDFGPHRVEREEAFCLDAINAIGDYTEARRRGLKTIRWTQDSISGVWGLMVVCCRMSGDRQPIRSPLASCMSARSPRSPATIHGRSR